MSRRAWLELVTGALAGTLAVVTAAWGNWIELAFGVDPDHGSGALEWAIVAAAAAVCLALMLAVRWEVARRAALA